MVSRGLAIQIFKGRRLVVRWRRVAAHDALLAVTVIPWLKLQPSVHRYYPYNDVAAHVIGYVGTVQADHVGKNDPYREDPLQRYEKNDLIGRSGLEALCEPLLRGKRGRIEPKFDKRIVRGLDKFQNTDLLSPQWQIFDALGHAPLLLMRTELSDLLRLEVFDKMTQRRGDALRVIVPNEGSPALLEGPAETGTLAGFVTLVSEEDARRRL